MTELGEIGLRVPRTRTYSGLAVVRAYARRATHIDRMILACFVLGLSTRKVATALLPVPMIAPLVFPPCPPLPWPRHGAPGVCQLALAPGLT